VGTSVDINQTSIVPGFQLFNHFPVIQFPTTHPFTSLNHNPIMQKSKSNDSTAVFAAPNAKNFILQGNTIFIEIKFMQKNKRRFTLQVEQ
jgi:hypothetical protein